MYRDNTMRLEIDHLPDIIVFFELAVRTFNREITHNYF